MAHNCPECGMRHERPLYQATTDDPVAIHWADVGCAAFVVVAVVAFLWTLFLLWPA